MKKEWDREEWWHRPHFLYGEKNASAETAQEIDVAGIVEQGNLEQQGTVVFNAQREQMRQ